MAEGKHAAMDPRTAPMDPDLRAIPADMAQKLSIARALAGAHPPAPTSDLINYRRTLLSADDMKKSTKGH